MLCRPLATIAVAVLLGGCGRVSFDPRSDATTTDAATDGDLDASLPDIDLEVPIELLDIAVANAASLKPVPESAFVYRTDDYDGVVETSFEVIAFNNDPAPFDVDIVAVGSNENHGTLTVTQTGTTNTAQRFRAPFSPMPGTGVYEITIGAQSATAGRVFAARLVVRQRAPTKTRVYIPLTQFHFSNTAQQLDQTTSTTYVQPQPNSYSVWRKDGAAFTTLANSVPWQFEVVTSNSAGGTAYASLFTTQGAQIGGAETISSNPGPTGTLVGVADNAANFTDGTDVEVRIRSSSTANTVSLYRAGLWVLLDPVVHAEAYYRVLRASYEAGASWTDETGRILPDIPAQASASFEGVVARDAADPPLSCFLVDELASDQPAQGSEVAGSRIGTSSTVKVRIRTPAFATVLGHRYTAGCTGKRYVSAGYLVISK